MARPHEHEIDTPGDIGDELANWNRSLKAQNLSINTIDTYGTAVEMFAQWSMDNGRPTDIASVTTAQVEEWVVWLLGRNKDTTADNRFRGLRSFFTWYAGEDDDFTNPMAKMKRPDVVETVARVLTLDQVREVISTCGDDFIGQRDEAVLRLLFDMGSRRQEIATLLVDPPTPRDPHVDTKRGLVYTLEKGKYENVIAINDRTIDAVVSYLRKRKKHTDHAMPWLWLGARGRFTHDGIYQMVAARGMLAGIQALKPHDFRSTATHHELAAGMQESEVMEKHGWRTTAMPRRYAKSLSKERANEATRRIGLGNKV